MLKVEKLQHWFGRGQSAIPVVDIAQLDIKPGCLTVISGPSGSGKTTLLYLLAGLLVPRLGKILWQDTELNALGEGARDKWRRTHAGFVFQNFNLIDEMTPLQNVALAAYFGGWSSGAVKTRARELLSGMDVPDAARPLYTFSRGEQQRVALARALLFDPAIVFADEPTASLDAGNAVALTKELQRLAKEGRTVIAVSHDAALLEAADETIRMERGQMVGADKEKAA